MPSDDPFFGRHTPYAREAIVTATFDVTSFPSSVMDWARCCMDGQVPGRCGCGMGITIDTHGKLSRGSVWVRCDLFYPPGAF